MSRQFKYFEDHPVKFSTALQKGMFRAMCTHVVDGDTADFLIDLGYYHYSYAPIRFKDIDTPELRGVPIEEKRRAEQARDRVKELILDKPVLIRSSKDKISFGRFVGDIWFPIDDPGDYENIIEVPSGGGDELVTFILMSDLLKKEGLEKIK